jgi:hypothetical protein
MVNKVNERLYAESAARLLGFEWELIDIEEPLDFEVKVGNETFGLEVRQIFTDPEGRAGSKSKQNESKNQKRASALARMYKAKGGTPVNVKFLGSLEAISDEELVAEIIANCSSLPSLEKRLEFNGLIMFLSPQTLGHDNVVWSCIEDRVGWVRAVTSSTLQDAVNKKQEKLPLYLRKYSNIVLLLVADRTLNSGRLSASQAITVVNPGFSAIYFLSYPEEVIRVA